MDDQTIRILRSTLEFLLLAALTAAIPLIVYIDNVVISGGVSEYSITELLQDILILFSITLFWGEAWRCPRSRGFLVLVGGFFACVLIRELDFVFDTIHHGFWLYPALLATIVSVAGAIASKKTVLAPMATYVDSKSCIYVSIGLVIVLVFSRLFGSGRLIWISIMGADYKSEYKTIVQEGLELFGYMFIFYGSCLLPQKQLR